MKSFSGNKVVVVVVVLQMAASVVKHGPRSVVTEGKTLYTVYYLYQPCCFTLRTAKLCNDLWATVLPILSQE